MSGLSANSHDIYAASNTNLSQVGSRINVGQLILPNKSIGITPGSYSLLFDDVSASAIPAAFSGISTDVVGAVTIKTRGSAYIFSNTGTVIVPTGGGAEATGSYTIVVDGVNTYLFNGNNTPYPQISINGRVALGGAGGQYGICTNQVYSNVSNISSVNTVGMKYSRVGLCAHFQFEMIITMVANPGAASFEYTDDQIFQMLPLGFPNGSAALGACGQGLAASGPLSVARQWYIVPVDGEHRVLITTAGVPHESSGNSTVGTFDIIVSL